MRRRLGYRRFHMYMPNLRFHKPNMHFNMPDIRLPSRNGQKRVHHVGLRRLLNRRTIALLLLFLTAFIVICVVLERRASPQIHTLAETIARQQAAEAISFAVEQILADEQVSYERLVSYHSEGESIRSIQTNALEVNLIRAKINTAVEQAVTLRRGRLKLPMGAMTNSDLLAGRGPNLTVPLRMAGSALSDIRSDLSSGGLNQTMVIKG